MTYTALVNRYEVPAQKVIVAFPSRDFEMI